MSNILAHNLETGNRTEDVNIDNATSFDTMLLPEYIMKGLTDTGFKRPSPIQLKAIPVGRCGFDLVVKSKAGTGKTLVFTVIALDAINLSKAKPQVLVVVPTREIAVQVQEVFQKIGSHMKGLKAESFIGGMSLAEDKEKSKSCHIAVGTPGRIKHLITDQSLKTDSIKLFILDEADKLVESSFLNDINEIYNSLPFRKQLITTSATYPDNLQELLGRYMISPSFITVEINNPFLLGIKQFVKLVQGTNNVVQQLKIKNETLIHLLSNISFTQCLVFTNYQNRAESISNHLNQKGWQSTFISAAQTQVKRLAAIDSLKNFKCRILLTTDLTARGIDASNVDLVINYDIPIDPVTYLHRMGRAGRYGSSGVCINLASTSVDLPQLQKILGAIGGVTLSIPQLPEFTGTLSELFKVEVAEDQYIFGTAGQFDTKLRNEILTMKNEETGKKSPKSKDAKEVKKTDNIMDMLKGSVNEINSIREQVAEMNTDDILASLASGDFNIESGKENGNKQRNTASTRAVEEILTTKSVIFTNTAPKTPEKAKVVNKNEEVQQNEQQPDLVYKNKALFEVAKLLNNQKDVKQVTDDPLQNYLSILKKQENEEVSNLATSAGLTDILGILENNDTLESSTEENSEPLEQKESTQVPELSLENIFRLGYENIVKKDGVFKNFIEEFGETIARMECETSEKESEEEIDESDDSDTEPEIMKWVPVKRRSGDKKKAKSTSPQVENDNASCVAIESTENYEGTEQVEQNYNTETNVETYEYLSGYFNECSEELWQTGLRFNTVSDFDNWYYYYWLERVNNVRDYIQQNIYVQEMSRYQNNSTEDNGAT